MKINPYIHQAKYYETDQMGIIHHSNYIRWFEEARIDFMKQIGLSYKTMEEEGIISPVLAIDCKYIKMMYFDDLATIIVNVIEYTGLRFSFSYEIYNSNNELCVTGNSKHCFINKDNHPISLKRINSKYHDLFLSIQKEQ